MHQVVKEYIHSLTARIPDGDAEQAAKASGWVSSLLNYTQTIGVVRQAKGERGLSITLAEMGDRPHLLNMRNGTYDLEADIFRGHSADDFIFYCCDSDYVEGQKSELWERVVSEIFDGDAELIDYVRRIFGNSINGDCSDPIFNIFYGSGANGKSTIVGTINALLSDYSRNLPSELFDKNKDLHPTYLATLRGCRLAVVAELESDVHLAESTIKKVTSTDVIEARRMRQDPFYFKPTHTSVLCTNHLPTIKNSDKGIWRRIKCVPFLVDLSDRKDATIPERLKAELAGVANWLIQGHREYKKHGVGTCKAVEAATASYRDSENEFKRMIEDIFTEADADCKMPVTDALQTYARHGGRLGRKKFVTEMAQLGYIAEKLPYNGSNLRCFTGLRLTLTEFGD